MPDYTINQLKVQCLLMPVGGRGYVPTYFLEGSDRYYDSLEELIAASPACISDDSVSPKTNDIINLHGAPASRPSVEAEHQAAISEASMDAYNAFLAEERRNPPYGEFKTFVCDSCKDTGLDDVDFLAPCSECLRTPRDIALEHEAVRTLNKASDRHRAATVHPLYGTPKEAA